ncbi:MAG: leucine-rich repeat protein [Bacteroidaceae bacterium]|nr:leucine-rich repeat protein [Bacteroidaceae bacterium]
MEKKEYIQPQTLAVALSHARTLLQTSYDLGNARNASDNGNPVMDAKEHNSNDVNLWDKAWSLFIAFLLLPLWAMAAPVEVTTTAGGQLQEKLVAQSISPTDVDTLTVTGPLNGTDIEYLHRYLTSIKALYLSNAQIVNGGDSYHRWTVSGSTATQYGNSSFNTALNTVGNYMFADLPKLTTLVLPSGVTAIGDYALADCPALTSLSIPNGVTTIGKYAFSYYRSTSYVNKLTTLTLPSSLTMLGIYAFSYTKSLKRIEIPENLTTIPEYCFYESGVQEVVLPDGLTTIGNYAFSYSGLQSLSLPSTLTTLGENAFSSCSSLSGPLTLPAALTSLPTYAFQSCTNLNNVTFSEGLQTIGSHAFYDCRHLTAVQLPSTVTTIGSRAFQQCYRLETLALPSGLTSLGVSAFYECDSLASFTFPEAITTVPDNILYSCDKLSSVTLASGTTAIGSSAFDGCAKITAIDLSPYTQLTRINSQAFARTGLVKVELPNRIKLQGQYCFQNCKQLKSINIPTATTELPSYIFYGCSALTDVTLHDGVTEIGYDAFSNCTSLESIALPSGITDIQGSAFTNCRKLQLATFPSSLKNIGNYAFQNCKALTQANLPAGIKSIGTQAFDGSGVREASLPTGITTLNSHVFYNCDSLRTVTWPADQTRVPQCMFQSCDSLKTIVLPDAVTTIDGHAFYGCKGLGNDFHFPASLTSIGGSAFCNTTGLTDIELPASLTSIGSNAFEGSGLTHIEIPDNVTSLGGSAFQYCDSLRTAELGRKMKYDGNSYFDYFYSCDSLKRLRIFAGTPPTLNSNSYISAYYKKCTLEVPAGVDDLYRAANYWKDFKEIRTFLTGDKLHATDYAILQALYEQWDGANWTHPWDLTTDDRFVDKWHGVTFNGDHIATLNLEGCNLHGSLTQTVFELPALTSLNLGNNYLTGQLDTILVSDYSNSTLTSIKLNANELEGDLSPFATKFSALTYLNVAHNRLTAISSPISRTTLTSVGSNLYYHRQFCDNKTKLPFVSEDYPAKQVHFGEDLGITWNSLQTYQHSDQNYSRSITSLYHIYYYNNSLWTYESPYSFYTYSNNKWAPSTSRVLYPLRDEPMLLSPSTNTDYQTTVVVQFSWDDGDVNADLTVDVLDLQHVVSFAASGDKLSGKVFNFTAADAVTDGIIDVRDIVKTVDAILDFEEEASPAAVRPYILYNKRVRASEAAQSNIVAIEGDCLRLANTDAVAALQLTIAGQRADDLMLAPDLRGFALSKRQVGSDTRVVIYNLSGRTIAAGEHDLLMGLDAQAVIADARLTDTEANYLPAIVCDDATPLQTIEGGFTTDADIFDLSGRRIPSLETAPAGIYVIKKGNKQFKVRK